MIARVTCKRDEISEYYVEGLEKLLAVQREEISQLKEKQSSYKEYVRQEYTYVVCRNFAEFKNLGYNPMCYRYVSSALYLRGLCNVNIKFDGTWFNHPDILEIILQAKVLNAKFVV